MALSQAEPGPDSAASRQLSRGSRRSRRHQEIMFSENHLVPRDLELSRKVTRRLLPSPIRSKTPSVKVPMALYSVLRSSPMPRLPMTHLSRMTLPRVPSALVVPLMKWCHRRANRVPRLSRWMTEPMYLVLHRQPKPSQSRCSVRRASLRPNRHRCSVRRASPRPSQHRCSVNRRNQLTLLPRRASRPFRYLETAPLPPVLNQLRIKSRALFRHPRTRPQHQRGSSLFQRPRSLHSSHRCLLILQQEQATPRVTPRLHRMSRRAPSKMRHSRLLSSPPNLLPRMEMLLCLRTS